MKAVIFDMDGVLIDSEPLWKLAEIETFAKIGIPMTIEMCNLTMGYRTSEVIKYWYQRKPWDGPSQEEVTRDLIDTVIRKINEEGKIMEGVLDSLEWLKRHHVPVALASSSTFKIIDTVIQKLKIKEYFKVVESAELLEFGKPHPAVFISAATKLGVDPTYCLVIEDSVNGVIAGKAAKMNVIAVPDASMAGDKRFAIADKQLQSLKEFRTVAEQLFAVSS